jgi:predicted alpha/beta hydrolase family esterase
MKRAIIVHRWGGSSAADWYPWLSHQLSGRGWQVDIPDMPDPEEPRMESWTAVLDDILSQISDEDEVLFVGHSLGCQAIVRTLEDADLPVRAVFVAGWFTLEGLDGREFLIAEPWLDESIDFETARAKLIDSVAIFSDDDPYVPPPNKSIFKERLGSHIVEVGGRGHFDESSEIFELPEILPLIEAMV